MILRDGASVDGLEDGHLHAGDVIDADFDALLRGAHALDDHRLDVSRRILDLRQRKFPLLNASPIRSLACARTGGGSP